MEDYKVSKDILELIELNKDVAVKKDLNTSEDVITVLAEILRKKDTTIHNLKLKNAMLIQLVVGRSLNGLTIERLIKQELYIDIKKQTKTLKDKNKKNTRLIERIRSTVIRIVKHC